MHTIIDLEGKLLMCYILQGESVYIMHYCMYVVT